MKAKHWRGIGIFLYLALMAFSFFALGYGAILPSTTIFIYISIFLITAAAIKLSVRNGDTRKNILLLLASTLCILLATEFVLRYVVKPKGCLNYAEQNGKLYYRSLTLRQAYGWLINNADALAPPNHKAKKAEVKTEFNYKYTYNSLHLRGAEWTKEKQAGTKRIIVLGDSFAEGVGAPADSSWPVLLQQMLNAEGQPIEVLNAGISGSDPYYELKLLQTKLLAYKPDMVIMAINKSDLNDIALLGGNERFITDTTIRVNNGAWWEPIYGASMIARLVVHGVLHYNYNLLTASQQAEKDAKATLLLNEAIDNFKTLGTVENFKPIVVFHPLLADLQKNENPLADNVKYAKRHGLQTIDLFAAYRTYFAHNAQPASSYYWPIDLHHNSRGYHLFANKVSEQFLSQP